MSRKEELKKILIDVSDSTSIYFHQYSFSVDEEDKFLPSMKLYSTSGIIFYVGKTRKFPIVRLQIPSWNPKVDLEILEEICNGENFIWCESDKEDDEYVYTISLKRKF